LALVVAIVGEAVRVLVLVLVVVEIVVIANHWLGKVPVVSLHLPAHASQR